MKIARPAAARALVASVLTLALAACGSSGGTATSSPPSSAPATGPTTSGPATSAAASISGSIDVLAAASLTESFGAGKAAFTTKNPGVTVRTSFAGSQALVTQIQQGAPADVIATADDASMAKLVDAGLVDTPRTFARNRLIIAVAPGNPKGVKGLADLARKDLTIVLAAPEVPVGKYGQQALAKAGVTAAPKSMEQDVKSALTKVTAGEADATIVYATDVTASKGKADGVTIPDDQNVVATYPIAVVKATKARPAAEAFVASAVSGEVQQAVVAAGFSAL